MDSGEIIEELKCPVCFEIPEGEIYLCKNGHTICHVCSESVKLCPQCRVSLEVIKIRNRALEVLLDTLKLDCNYKDQGCLEKFGRKEIQQHLSSCSFNGKRVQFCKSIGLQCTFSTNLNNIPLALQHFIESHGITFRGERDFPLHLQNFDKAVALKFQQKNLSSMWTPVIVDDGNLNQTKGSNNEIEFRMAARLIILSIINGSDKSASWMCVCLSNDPSEAPKYHAEFTIQNQSDGAPAMIWKIAAVDVSHIDTVLPNSPFRIPSQYLLEHFVNKEGALLVNVKVTYMKQGGKKQTIKKEPTWLLNSVQHNPERALCLNTAALTIKEVKCQNCGICPISDIRYKQLQAINYNLCKTCFQQGPNSNRWFAIITKPEQGELVDRLWEEKQLKWSISLMGPPLQYNNPKCVMRRDCKNRAIYTCLQCNDVRHFSLCRICMINEPGNHIFAMYIYQS